LWDLSWLHPWTGLLAVHLSHLVRHVHLQRLFLLELLLCVHLVPHEESADLVVG
jgi:hypothetical protein